MSIFPTRPFEEGLFFFFFWLTLVAPGLNIESEPACRASLFQLLVIINYFSGAHLCTWSFQSFALFLTWAPTIPRAVKMDGCVHQSVPPPPPLGTAAGFRMASRRELWEQQSLGLTPPDPRGSGFPRGWWEGLGNTAQHQAE